MALSLCFLMDSSLVLCSASVLVTTGSMRRYLQLNQVAHCSLAPPGCHIHTCGHKMVCCVSQHSRKSMEEIPGDRLLGEESWTGPEKGINPAAGPVSAPLCEEEQEEHCQSSTKWPPAGYRCACFWPNCQKQTLCLWQEGLTSTNGTCAHSPAPCSSIAILQRTPELADPPLAPRSLHKWEQVQTLRWCSGPWVTPGAAQWLASCGQSA